MLYSTLNVPISKILEPLSRTFENVEPFILIVQLNALNVFAYIVRMRPFTGKGERIQVFQFYTLHNFRKSSKTSVALDKIYDTLTHTHTHHSIYYILIHVYTF